MQALAYVHSMTCRPCTPTSVPKTTLSLQFPKRQPCELSGALWLCSKPGLPSLPAGGWGLEEEDSGEGRGLAKARGWGFCDW